MLLTPTICLASVAIIGTVHGVKNLASEKRLFVAEPQATSDFRIYEVPVKASHHLTEKRSQDAGLQNSILLALAYLKEKHNIRAEHARITGAHTDESSGLSHVYVRQTVDGVDVLNGRAHVNINKDGTVISSSQNFAPIHQVRKVTRRPPFTARSQSDSLKFALRSLSRFIHTEIADVALQSLDVSVAKSDDTRAPKFVVRGIPEDTAVDGTATAYQSMLQRADGSLVHVWDIALQQGNHYWNARINADTGHVESLRDRVSHYIRDTKLQELTGSSLHKRYTYRVVPINKPDPLSGFKNVANPELATPSSPNGWVSGTITGGNNVIAFKTNSRGVANQTSAGAFDYVHDGMLDPTVSVNVNAAITQAFFTLNVMHDIFYIYGFTESSYNFQHNNFNRGGQGNDGVVASVQDASGTNNANIFVPPDGQSPTIRLYIFTYSNPNRDGAFETGVVAGLYAMGMANRLVGGGTASCFQTLESTGLLVGWGDVVADWLANTASVDDFTIGSYTYNRQGGARRYPYSRSRQVNPLTYSSIYGLNEEEDIGQVWANIMHNAFAALADGYGWSMSAFTNAAGTQGNVVFMHLLVDGLKISPCNPTFIQARNAFIQADINRYNGAHYCTLWRAFASRGLGYSAANYRDDFSLPSGC